MYLKYIFFTIFIFFSTSFVSLSASTDQHDAYSRQIADFFHLPSTTNLTLLKVKGFQQTEEYTCGPATVMSLMNYYGMLKENEMNKKTEDKISKEMGTSKDAGTSPQQMVTWLEGHGFDVKYGINGTVAMLRDNLKKGIPTIVEWIDWGGHWEIVTGYNAVGKTMYENKDTIFFANPSAHYESQNIQFINGITAFNPDRFESMWFDAQYFNPGHLVKGIYIVAIPKSIRSP